MKRAFLPTTLAAAMFVAAAVHAAAPQIPPDEQQALRARIEQRYDVVPLSGGVALTPKSARGDLRLIEISDSIAINGVAVSGRELRERVGADADTILRLSYLGGNDLRKLFARATPQVEPDPGKEPPPTRELPVERATPTPPPPPEPLRHPSRRSSGDRVRVFGDVVVSEGEEVTGEVVAVLGSVRIDGEVSRDVVAVLGTVELGPHAVVRGDVVTVGGRLRRAPGAQVNGSVTEVSAGGLGGNVHVPWMWGWSPFYFGEFGPVARLVGTTFRVVLLALVACIALVVARRAVEGSAQRVADEPLRATLVGLVAWVLVVPVFTLAVVVLSISIIGIPLLLLMPFAVLLLLLMAIVGFSGTATAVGQWARRRFGIGSTSGVADVCLGILIILLPLLLARVVALGGWALSPIVFLLVATSLCVEFLAWSSGFGAVLTNAFSRWQATRAARFTPRAPTVTP
jgi:hypothetical protein